MLLVLIMFMYAVLGVQVFTFVRQQEEAITADRNFVHVGRAFLLLFQCLTGDDWSAVMAGCMIQPGDGSGCTLEAGDCGSSLAVPFFVSFQVRELTPSAVLPPDRFDRPRPLSPSSALSIALAPIISLTSLLRNTDRTLAHLVRTGCLPLRDAQLGGGGHP